MASFKRIFAAVVIGSDTKIDIDLSIGEIYESIQKSSIAANHRRKMIKKHPMSSKKENVLFSIVGGQKMNGMLLLALCRKSKIQRQK